MSKNIRLRKKSIAAFVSMFMFVLLACNKQKLPEAKFDFSSLTEFEKIEKKLLQDIDPDEEEWTRLLSTPAYEELCSREFKKEWMKHYMQGGIMPSERSLIKEWEEKGYWDVKFLKHFKEVSERSDSVHNFIEELQSDDHYAREALIMVKEYLPVNVKIDTFPPISFLYFDKDARGYDPIIIDLLFAYELSKQDMLVELIAHEMHHYIRNKHLNFNYPDEKSPDSRIVWMLDQVHKEGIADQIDKEKRFEKDYNVKYKEKFFKITDNINQYIQQMDSLLAIYDESNDNAKAIAKEISRTAPMSGHPMGYYMANVIIKVKGKKCLINTFNDPFEFFYLYQEAAIENGTRTVFSDKAIKSIQRIETKYKKDLDV